MAAAKNPKLPSPGLPGTKNLLKTNSPLNTFINNQTLVLSVSSTQSAYDAAVKKLATAQKAYDASIRAANVASSPIRSFSSDSLSGYGKVTVVHQVENRINVSNFVFITGLSTYNGLWQVESVNSGKTSLSYAVPAANFVSHASTPSSGTIYLDATGGDLAHAINIAYIELKKAKATVAATKTALDSAKKAAGKLVGSGGTTGGAKDTPAPTIITGSDKSAVTYNIPSVKEAYFSSSSASDSRTKTYDQEVLFVDSGNRPVAVNEAQTLWMDNQAHKGMFQTFIVPKTDATKNVGSNTSGVKGRQAQQNVANVGRYGFQFLYNPGTIQMGYAGAPNIDPGLMMSNQQMIPLIGAANTSSAISFNLLLNRMPDMKYVNTPNESMLTPAEFHDVYGRHAPEGYEKSLKKIRDSGTMYDVEFLLQTLLGYEAWSTLRNRYTSDIGYIGSFPVELHLGKSLRYVVLVQDISVTHTIFTKDMVPVYSNISITAGRLPDSGFNTLLHSYTPPQGNARDIIDSKKWS